MVAAAVIGSAVVGAGATAVSAGSAAKAQSKAAAQASSDTRLQLEQQQRQYDQDRADLAPYRSVGTGALYTLSNLLGIADPTGGGSDWNAYLQSNPDVLAGYNALSPAEKERFPTAADYAQFHYQNFGRNEGRSVTSSYANPSETGILSKSFTMDDYKADPGYQFRLDQGNRGIEASAAARGGVLSGGTLKALARYNQDAASQEYGAAYNRFNNDQTTRFNRLSALAGIGQTATNSGIAAGANNQAAQAAGTQAIANNTLAAGNARASQYVATGNAVGNAVGNVGNYFALRDLYTPTTGGAYGISGSTGIY